MRQPANGDVATAPAQDIAASTALLDDITYSQLMWSQDPYRQQGSPPGARERPAADVDPIAGTRLSYEVVDKYTRWFRQSLLSTTSTVELEIDVHESFIVVGESASPDSNQQAPAVSGERCPTASSGDETVVPVFSHVHSLGHHIAPLR